jgi:hypothetical protein
MSALIIKQIPCLRNYMTSLIENKVKILKWNGIITTVFYALFDLIISIDKSIDQLHELSALDMSIFVFQIIVVALFPLIVESILREYNEE